METPRESYQMANKCEQQAALVKNPEAREILLEVARKWRKLADEMAREASMGFFAPLLRRHRNRLVYRFTAGSRLGAASVASYRRFGCQPCQLTTSTPRGLGFLSQRQHGGRTITSSRSEWCHRDVLFLGPILRFELLNARRQHEPRHLSVSRFTPWSASTTGVGSCWRPSLTDSASRSGGPSGWLSLRPRLD
jgi:hypothetical protein